MAGLVLVAALTAATVQAEVEVRAGAGGLSLAAGAPGHLEALLTGVSYQAVDDAGLVFKTTDARLEPTGEVVFSLEGPAAAEAKVTARLTSLLHGFRLDWSIVYTGAKRKWDGWTGGFRYSFARENSGARSCPVTRWVRPTGAKSWEVPGDALYPDLEWQLRQVIFGDTALVIADSEYNPDWFYQGDPRRVGSSRRALPAEPPFEIHNSTAFLLLPTAELDPVRLAAEAAGRPLTVALGTGRTGNLFAPQEPISLKATVDNVSTESGTGKLALTVHDYQGSQLLDTSYPVALGPLAKTDFAVSLPGQPRGVLFVDYRLSWEGGEYFGRTTLGILPDRKASGTLASSPFGMSSLIATPERYPDQYGFATVSSLQERIGVRWLRTSPFTLKETYTAEDDQRAHQRIDVLASRGILPHVHPGSSMPKEGEEETFRKAFKAALQRFSWTGPYWEIGNEYNLGVASAPDYINRMLRPIHEATREVFPQGKVMCAGLGGVHKPWFPDFVKAGGLEACDVLSIHPGCHPRAPEFWEGFTGWVFRPQMLEAMRTAAEHGNKEVWVTEAYAPTSPGRKYVDLRTSADYLVRTYACCLALGARVVEWYTFQDGTWFSQRPRPDDIEHNFGIVYTDLTPKPAYVAYGVMTEQLEGASCKGRLDLAAEDLYGVRFDRAGQTVDVLWSYRERHETDVAGWPPEKYAEVARVASEPWVERWKAPVMVTLPATGTVTVTDVMGRTRTLQPEGGQVTLSLTGSPIYVTGLGQTPMRKVLWE